MVRSEKVYFKPTMDHEQGLRAKNAIDANCWISSLLKCDSCDL